MNADATGTEWAPQILVLVCNWSLYAQSDLATLASTRKIPRLRVLKVPCAGRINPLFILTALQEGNDGVLVVGCPLGSCHYKTGNYLSQRKLGVLQQFLEYLGIEKGRVRFAWLDSTEEGYFSRLVQDYRESIGQLGPASKLVYSHFGNGSPYYCSP